MNEPRKTVLALAIVMIIGLLALAIEYLNDYKVAGGRWLALVLGGLMLLILMLTVHFGHARDLEGRFAQSQLKPWFDQLKSAKGLCCSDADGFAVSDVDWEFTGGHYRVRLDGRWVEVPDDAVITEPNRAGRTMVWPLRGIEGLTIRCFMPGSMS